MAEKLGYGSKMSRRAVIMIVVEERSAPSVEKRTAVQPLGHLPPLGEVRKQYQISLCHQNKTKYSC